MALLSWYQHQIKWAINRFHEMHIRVNTKPHLLVSYPESICNLAITQLAVSCLLYLSTSPDGVHNDQSRPLIGCWDPELASDWSIQTQEVGVHPSPGQMVHFESLTLSYIWCRYKLRFPVTTEKLNVMRDWLTLWHLVLLTNQRPVWTLWWPMRGQEMVRITFPAWCHESERGERMLWRVRKWILLSQDINISKYHTGWQSDQKSHQGTGN